MRRPRTAAAIVLVVAALVVAGSCRSAPPAPPRTVAGGDPQRGLDAIEAYGCASCHVIPGVTRAERSWTAPPLTNFGRRSYIAGQLVNTQDNLVRWIVDPQEVEPGTAMPELGVTEIEALDIAAYLHALR